LRVERISRVASASAAVLLALFVVACGGGSSNENQRLAGKSILDEGALKENLVSPEDLDKYPADSPGHAFLQYWAALQFLDYASADGDVDPGLRSKLGLNRLNDAFQAQSAFYRTQTPVIADQTTKGPDTSIRWAINDSNNNPTTHTTTLRRSGGRWLIVYDSFLGDSLALVAQEQVQARINPAASTPSPAALAAGDRARSLQLDYLDTLNP
jgi:hypothetical protein